VRGHLREGESPDGNAVEITVWSRSGVGSHLDRGRLDVMSLRCFNPQFFVASRVGDTALEVESRAAARRSRQEMGIVIDALRALSAALPLEEMPPGDRLAVDRLHGLAQGVDRCGPRDEEAVLFTTREVDDLIRRLRHLRRFDPESADGILRRLNEEAASVPVGEE
jgi:hypothetical protein